MAYKTHFGDINNKVEPNINELNNKMDKLLNKKEPSPSPASIRMPIGLKDFKEKLENQLTPLVDASKKGKHEKSKEIRVP